MFAQESVMDIQKEREAFERFKAKQIGIDYETLKKDLDDCEKRFPNNRYAGWNFKSDWELWQAAKAQVVPEGFILVPKENISCYWQDNDEPENFCSNESDFDCLGDCIDLGEIIEINKFTQAHVNKEKLFGTWFAEAIDPSEKANFFVGTHAECLEIVAKHKAMIEAQEPTND